ncbi:MAG: hypothetical protein ACPH3N_00800 [Alcanivorax sediminis]|uniref:hypothetical protein n=1 Tax=Alcanivorax sediminis TaxID=2663008 RepID=UPI003C65A54B
MADTKKMIHDAYGIQKLTRDGQGGDPVSGRLYRQANGVWAGKIMAAVEQQERPLGDILIMCYAPEWEDVNLKAIQRQLWAAFLRKHGEEIKQDRTLLKAKRMVEIAIFNFQRECQGGAMQMEFACQLMGIDQSHFYKKDRPWRKWWEYMGNQLHRWEREAIRKPASICDEIEALEQSERMQMAVP